MELLRLVAMFMVIVLHYLYKGGLRTPIMESFDLNSYIVWLIESFAIVAVNVYVLITGYFMSKSSLKLSRLLEIICQVLWYSLLIPMVLAILGVVDLSAFTTYDILQFVFPIHMKQYWFVTAYVILMLFVPLINFAIKHMSKQQLLTATCLLTAFETLPKSVVPFEFAVDEAGNNVLWLICLYLIGAYIRMYGIPFFATLKKSVISYMIGVLCIFVSLIVMRIIYFRIDAFGSRVAFAYDYNHIFCLAASVALFYTFLYIRIPEGKCSKIIITFAPYTFGVYLLHEHVLIRYEWVKWLRVTSTENVFVFVIELVYKCLLVLLLGIVLDWIRAKVFSVFVKVLQNTSISKAIQKMDVLLKG